MTEHFENLAEKVDRVRQLGHPLTQSSLEIISDFLENLRELKSRDHGIAVFVTGIIEWLEGLGHLSYALELARSVPDDDFAMLDDALGQWGETHEIFKVLKAQEFLERGMVYCAVQSAEDISSPVWRVYVHSTISLFFKSIDDNLQAKNFNCAALEALDCVVEKEVQDLVRIFIPVS